MRHLLQRAGRHYYTCLDLNWGFWNVPIDEETRKYMAFVTPFGLFEYNVIPFGVKNSPGEFEILFSRPQAGGRYCIQCDARQRSLEFASKRLSETQRLLAYQGKRAGRPSASSSASGRGDATLKATWSVEREYPLNSRKLMP